MLHQYVAPVNKLIVLYLADDNKKLVISREKGGDDNVVSASVD